MRDSSEVDVCPRCQKCDRWRAAPDYLRDPMLLWERFPCPPPGTDHARLLIELDWTGQMGTKDGCEALKRVAKRCHVDFRNFGSVSPSLPECEELFEAMGFCGLNCIIAVVLACICLLFSLLLVLVCVRYVKRSDKQSSPICAKVLASEPAAANTQVDKNYAQNQYLYRENGTVVRRGLPCEVRVTDNGVESRLLKAIQQNQLQQYNIDDLCSQCLAESRHSTLQSDRNRHGYEIIYWEDGEYFLKSVPSSDTFNPMSLNRDRSSYNSSANGSNLYEYISDHFNECSYNSTGRNSNHSTMLQKRHSLQNSKDIEYSGDLIRSTNDRETNIPCEWARDKQQYGPGWKANRTSVTSFHSKYQDRGHESPYWAERSPYQCFGSENGDYQGNKYCDRSFYKGYYSDTQQDIFSRHPLLTNHFNRIPNEMTDLNQKQMIPNKEATEDSGVIKGYKFAFNPSYYEASSNIQANVDGVSGVQKLQGEVFDIDDSTMDNNVRNGKHKQKLKPRRTSSCSCTSYCSDSRCKSEKSNIADNTFSSRPGSNTNMKAS